MKPTESSSQKITAHLTINHEQNEKLPLLATSQKITKYLDENDLDKSEQSAIAYMTMLGFKPNIEAMRNRPQTSSSSYCLIL